MLALLLAAWLAGAASADWPTYRGNNARTGNIDDQPGPQQPKVLWTYAVGSDASASSGTPGGQFLAPPVVTGDLVFVTSLGKFNTGYMLGLETRDSQQRLRWSKLNKLPTVSSPASAGGVVFFSDGMHVTDGASLYAVAGDTGRRLWKFTIPGSLVHMEGTPALVNGRAFMGAGHGGVFCLDTTKLLLGGQELSAEEIQRRLDAEWQKLVATYEKEKQEDPDFALPPSEDSLPNVTPKLVWQQGQNVWHVDAPVAVAGGKVLAASAYLDKEKTGERALHCLDAATGAAIWKAPLALNPWAGATVVEGLAILGGSNIRLEPKDIPKARGSLTAINLADGSVAWTRNLPGGVTSSVAAKGGLLVSCCTDGQVRANEVTSGEPKWTYSAGAPLFAAPAIAGDIVYAGDLNGVVHAIRLADGQGVWKLDLNASVAKGGKIYGGPVVHGGRIYVGTCNPEATGDQLQAVVCIGQ